MELKLANMEDRWRRCNIHVTGLDEGLEGSNAAQFLSHSLPKWFPTLDGTQIEIMNARKSGVNHILILNVLHYSSQL